jgi:O-antigen ligase
MLSTPGLYHSYPYALRVGLLFALIFLTVRYTKRGIQNGLLLGLIVSMSGVSIALFRSMGPIPDISLDRVVWPAVWLIFFLQRRQGNTERLPLDWVERCILVFSTVALISLISYGSYAAGGGWDLGSIVRGYTVPFSAYFIARRSIRSDKQLHGFFVGMGFIALYLALNGLMEALKINSLVFPQFILNPHVGTHEGRVRGIFLVAGPHGLAIAMVLPILVWLYCTDRVPRRWLWPVVAALALVPLALTLSRAGWLGGITALGGMALAWPRRRAVLTGLIIYALVGGLLLASETVLQRMETRLETESTIEWRFARIQIGWAMFRANPVTGVGLNRFGIESPKYALAQVVKKVEPLEHAHNTWMTLLAELGLAGFLPYLAIFGYVLFMSLRYYWQHPQYRVILGMLMSITLAFMVVASSMEIRGFLYHNTLLFVLWGSVLEVIHRRHRYGLKGLVSAFDALDS